MIKEGKFGAQEVICMLTIAISTKVFFTRPAFLVRLTGTSAWYTILLSDLTAIVAFTFIYLLLKRFPGKNIVEIFDTSMGRIIGFLFSFAFMIIFILMVSVFLREFTEVLRTYTYEDTPSSMIEGAFVITVGVVSFLGLETIARVSKLFAYFLLIGFIAVIILSAKYFNFKYLFPILGYGLDKTIIQGFFRSSSYAEIAVLAIFASSLQGIKQIKKAGYVSLILSGLILSIGSLCFILLYPYFSQQELVAPYYEMTRLIKYGTFFTRLDSFFLIVWTISTFITISIIFYASISTYCKAFRLQDKRPVIVSMYVILFATALAPRSLSDLVDKTIQTLRDYTGIVLFGLPLIALITAVIRKKKGKKSYG